MFEERNGIDLCQIKLLNIVFCDFGDTKGVGFGYLSDLIC